MSNKHTPGPWYSSPNGNYVRATGIHGWNICMIEDQPPYTEANTKLIAAAPELLQALNALTNYVRDNFNVRGDNILSIADAAISKATL